jgi:uncharacterized protein (DUF433 family)
MRVDSAYKEAKRMLDEPLLERIERNPAVMVGKPVIRGTRIPVDLLVRLIAQGISEEEILRQYTRLQPEDIQAALLYAAQHSHTGVIPNDQ